MTYDDLPMNAPFRVSFSGGEHWGMKVEGMGVLPFFVSTPGEAVKIITGLLEWKRLGRCPIEVGEKRPGVDIGRENAVAP